MAIDEHTRHDEADFTGRELLISADSHVIEPLDLWHTRLPASLRDRLAPLKERWGEHSGGTVPEERFSMMAADDVSMEVLFPTYGLYQYGLDDVELHEACCRVYNDWIAEYCAATPGRLIGIPMIPTYDIDRAINELTRSKEMGLRGAQIWHVPPPGLEFTTDHYERLWAAASEMDEPINLHIQTGFSYVKAGMAEGVEHYRGNVEHKLQDAVHILFDLIFYRVFDRHPRLKVVLVEFEIGWIAWILQQWDFYARRFSKMNPSPTDLRPSEYFERNLFATFLDDRVGINLIASGWGAENCMWSSDYPHGGSRWPDSRQAIAQDLGGLDANTRSRLLHGNVAKLYNLELPSPINAR